VGLIDRFVPDLRKLKRAVAERDLELDDLRYRVASLTKECALQRTLIAALRDVNGTLDARCNRMEGRDAT